MNKNLKNIEFQSVQWFLKPFKILRLTFEALKISSILNSLKFEKVEIKTGNCKLLNKLLNDLKF